jgi:hypothetical protein
VRKAINTGRLQRSVQRDGKLYWIDPEVADIEWGRNTAPEFQRKKEAINAGKRAASGDGEPLPPAGPPVGKGGATYASAKAAAEGYKAMLLKLDHEERAGKLLDKSTAERSFAAAGMQVRDAVMRTSQQMVGEIATAVGGLTQEQRAAVMQVIDRHHVRALEELVRAAGVS